MEEDAKETKQFLIAEYNKVIDIIQSYDDHFF